MIFISGVHGAGKSFFCDLVRKQIGIKSYSASKLIIERKKAGFPASKLIPDIDESHDLRLSRRFEFSPIRAVLHTRLKALR